MNDCKQVNTAGGSPAASYFFLLRQRKSKQKEGDPGEVDLVLGIATLNPTYALIPIFNQSRLNGRSGPCSRTGISRAAPARGTPWL